MKLIDTLKEIVASSGLPKAHIAKKAGKSKVFVNDTFRTTNPTANNVAALLDACGYNLCLVKPDEAPASAIRITVDDCK